MGASFWALSALTFGFMSSFGSWSLPLDAWIAAMLIPIAIAILLSGLDDLILDLVCLRGWFRNRSAERRAARPPAKELRQAPQRRIAIFVPCWNEHAVIGRMVEHNTAAIDYHAYDLFIGAYPNDDLTIAAARELETRFPHVHLAICPHDGPTSKADCLNWIYQSMLVYEEEHGPAFEMVVTHDAEDLVHPESLLLLNWYGADYDMVQIPVLPLPTAFRAFTHGVYIDEFAEFQMKDMRARGMMGSFIPSNGVGTGYTRAALEGLAGSAENRVFEPACLTEDYENGMRLHRLRYAQIFVPLGPGETGVIATREYFPQTLAAAIRQRTRWVMGIALQTWERHGWNGSLPQRYWLWRDRKGLLGNPLSLLTNAMFAYGAVTWVVSRWVGQPWGLAQHQLHPALLASTLTLQVFHTSVRMACVARFYGWLFALGVPVRTVWANYINAAAACRALMKYTVARVRHQPLVWLKTEHSYPTRSALAGHRRRLGEILVGSGYLEPDDLEAALASQPAGLRLGAHLVRLGKLTEDELYEALSLQQSLPAGHLEPVEIPPKVARALPREIVRNWKVLPYRVAAGSLFLASPEIPTDDLTRALRGFTRLALRFQLITPANFEALTAALL
jgi:adsorption protein B